MIKRTLSRRLEVLDELIIPAQEPQVLHVEYIDAITKQVVGDFRGDLKLADLATPSARSGSAEKAASKSRMGWSAKRVPLPPRLSR